MRKSPWSSRSLKERRYAVRWMDHSVLHTRAFVSLAAAKRCVQDVITAFNLEYAYIEDTSNGNHIPYN